MGSRIETSVCSSSRETAPSGLTLPQTSIPRPWRTPQRIAKAARQKAMTPGSLSLHYLYCTGWRSLWRCGVYYAQQELRLLVQNTRISPELTHKSRVLRAYSLRGIPEGATPSR